MADQKFKRVKVGAGWKKTTQTGKTYTTIVINEPIEKGTWLALWENGYKQEEKQPDFILYKSIPADQAAAPSTEGPGESDFPQGGQGGDDIPF